MEGWIFGSEQSAQWTQNLYGTKYRFQNPLRQNYRHTRALAEFLSLPHEKFHSVVMFWGGCTFKTALPPNVLHSGYTTYIKSKIEVLLTEEEVARIVEALQTGRLPQGWKTRQDHIASLQDRHRDRTRGR